MGASPSAFPASGACGEHRRQFCLRFPALIFQALKQIRAFGQAQPACSHPLEFPSAELVRHRFG